MPTDNETTGFSFLLNGNEVSVQGIQPHTTLLQYLRDRGLTGAKEGCAEGECGACAAVITTQGTDGTPQYLAVNSCLVLLPSVAGREVFTVESLSRGQRLHPVQAAMVVHGASQCGFCTPGFVMNLFADYYRKDRSGFDPEAISGNLCRCTGYRPICDAARALEEPESEGDDFLNRLGRPVPPCPPLAYKADEGRFYRPEGLSELFDLLSRHPDARLVAGGTDLVVEINQRFARWPVLISLEGIDELRRFSWLQDRVELGAGLTLSDLEALLRGRLPLLEQLWPRFASRLIRNRATLGGNLATASPIGDSAPVLLALGAELRVAGAGRERTVPLDRFFTGYRKTALGAGEVLAAVQIPLPFPALSRFYKVSKRVCDDISTLSAAFALDLDADRTIARVRIAYGGVAPVPARAVRTEAALLGKPWNYGTMESAQRILATEFQPISDFRGSAEYRKAMVLNLLEKFFVDTGEVLAWKS